MNWYEKCKCGQSLFVAHDCIYNNKGMMIEHLKGRITMLENRITELTSRGSDDPVILRIYIQGKIQRVGGAECWVDYIMPKKDTVVLQEIFDRNKIYHGIIRPCVPMEAS